LVSTQAIIMRSYRCRHSSLTERVKERARAMGFHRVGIARAGPLGDAESRYHAWLDAGYAAGLGYMIQSRQLRAHPQRLVAGAETIISLAVSYYSGDFETIPPGHGRIARYAWGRDYHEVIPPRLWQLVAEVQRLVGRPVRARCFTDAVPLLERDVAARAGVGRIGWNSCLISDQWGSWLFLAEILLDVTLEPDPADHRACLSTRDCVNHCPTGAILRPFIVDARRCISYLTIEHRGLIPRELRPLVGDWLFGCDVCQEVCPHNQTLPRTTWPEFRPESGVGKTLALKDVLTLDSEEVFRQRFRHTALRRARRRGLVRNAAVVAANTGCDEVLPLLERLVASDPDEIVRAHAVWALGRFESAHCRQVLEGARRDPSPLVREEAFQALEGAPASGSAGPWGSSEKILV
jgi:epoxyqueuosine reductase